MGAEWLLDKFYLDLFGDFLHFVGTLVSVVDIGALGVAAFAIHSMVFGVFLAPQLRASLI